MSVVSPPLRDSEPPAARRGTIVLAVARPLLTAAALLVAYYLLPVDRQLRGWGLVLTRTDALYFSVTVFTTVGFGDITPVTQTARALVTGQMVGNLLVLGVALRVILTAVARGRRRKVTLDLPEKP